MTPTTRADKASELYKSTRSFHHLEAAKRLRTEALIAEGSQRLKRKLRQIKRAYNV